MKNTLACPLLATECLLGRYLKFCLVGGTGVLVDMAVLFVLTSPLMGWNLLLSKVIAAEVAIMNNFVWNELWTFNSGRQERSRDRVYGLLAFNLVCLAGIGWSVLLLHVQVSVLHMNVWLGNLIAIVLVSFWNFGLVAKWKSWRGGSNPAS